MVRPTPSFHGAVLRSLVVAVLLGAGSVGAANHADSSPASSACLSRSATTYASCWSSVLGPLAKSFRHNEG